jgi:hypothetical protein
MSKGDNPEAYKSGTSLDNREKNIIAMQEKAENKVGFKVEKSEKAKKPEDRHTDIDELKKDPFAHSDEKVEKERKAEFNKLSKDEKRRFIIKEKMLENRWLDKKDQHEISFEDEQFANTAAPTPGPQS